MNFSTSDYNYRDYITAHLKSYKIYDDEDFYYDLYDHKPVESMQLLPATPQSTKP